MLKGKPVFRRVGVLILFLLPMMLGAQEQNHWVKLGAGWNYAQMRDKGMSPLLYRGSLFALFTGYESMGDKKIQAMELDFAVGIAKPVTTGFSRATALTLRADLNYTFMQQTWTSDNGKYLIYSGGSLMNLATARQHSLYSNNEYNYEYFASLAAAGNLKRKFYFKGRRIDLDWQVRLPFLSFALRPAFSSSLAREYDPDKYSFLGSVLRSGDVVSLDHLLRLNSRTSSTYFLKNGNSFRLSYYWDYYGYNMIETNRVQAGFHGVTFSTLLNL